MTDKVSKVQQGFRILLPGLSGYICHELLMEFGGSYWWSNVLLKLNDQSNLPDSGDYAKLMDSLDIANCLRLIERFWGELFRKKLPRDCRTWASELMQWRNTVSHAGTADMADDDAWRALDTMVRFCEQLPDEEETVEQLREMVREVRYGSSLGSTAAAQPVQATGTTKATGILEKTSAGLKSWREIMEPHPDVAQGRYQHAEFAADLAQVARGEGAMEYCDPVEFFSRTYVTDGMKGLLRQALLRVTGKGGEPVIQLKTSFGGGKTHSMLALYHMLRKPIPIDKIPNMKPLLEELGMDTFPRANVAVIVGSAINPTKYKAPQNMPGIRINTLWGEIAAQLAQSAGDLSLYELVRESDRKGVSPGSETFKTLFDACGPCLILMDELVAYARKLGKQTDLPAGTFDNFIVFIQEITEAARASKNSIVVASIPESDIEVGGDEGKTALESIEHTFGRMESIWKPVAANEGFEVVRRRLFLPCKDETAKEDICRAFSQFYLEHKTDFPLEASELTYRERMMSCYPIHPEMFDRLYNDWSTLERFQRTRGVLRLMAAVIHELWMGNDASPMIMPGSLPLDVPNVSYELTRHLNSENWTSIIDSEVDGRHSVPYQMEQSNIRYGTNLAARRIARTVFLGSAPTSREQHTKGLEQPRIRLGAIQPEENISVFDDVLMKLQNKLTYFYSNPSNDRFWFDTRPTLRKTVEERASQIAAADVEYEIEQRLRKLRKDQPFSGLHICPTSTLDVTDEQSVRLVVLRPEDTFKSGTECAALQRMNDILNNRGTSPRIYKNMLAFLAPDQGLISSLKEGVRLYLAWESVNKESEDLNLDASQRRETRNSLERSNKTVDDRILEAYCWLVVPSIDRDVDMRSVEWNPTRISGKNSGLVSECGKTMERNEEIITKWAPMLLKMELDNLLWRDKNDLSIKQLWDYLTTYCYLPRLRDYSVLEEAIRVGLNSPEFFAYAAGVENGRYIDLKYNCHVSMTDISGFIVKPAAAQTQIQAQIEQEREKAAERARLAAQMLPNSDQQSAQPIGIGSAEPPESPYQPDNPDPPPVVAPSNTHFYMSAKLDNMRTNRDVQKLMEEVISHLTDLEGCDVDIHLEVSATNPDGFTVPIVRAVSENCRTLKVEYFSFEP